MGSTIPILFYRNLLVTLAKSKRSEVVKLEASVELSPQRRGVGHVNRGRVSFVYLCLTYQYNLFKNKSARLASSTRRRTLFISFLKRTGRPCSSTALVLVQLSTPAGFKVVMASKTFSPEIPPARITGIGLTVMIALAIFQSQSSPVIPT